MKVEKGQILTYKSEHTVPNKNFGNTENPWEPKFKNITKEMKVKIIHTDKDYIYGILSYLTDCFALPIVFKTSDYSFVSGDEVSINSRNNLGSYKNGSLIPEKNPETFEVNENGYLPFFLVGDVLETHGGHKATVLSTTKDTSGNLFDNKETVVLVEMNNGDKKLFSINNTGEFLGKKQDWDEEHPWNIKITSELKDRKYLNNLLFRLGSEDNKKYLNEFLINLKEATKANFEFFSEKFGFINAREVFLELFNNRNMQDLNWLYDNNEMTEEIIEKVKEVSYNFNIQTKAKQKITTFS